MRTHTSGSSLGEIENQQKKNLIIDSNLKCYIQI